MSAAPLCVACGEATAAPDRRRCPACLEAQRKHTRDKEARRRKTGTCIRCTRPAARGRTRCHIHLALAAAWQRAHARARPKEHFVDD